MSSEFAICAEGLTKRYLLYERPLDRLKQLLHLGGTASTREFWALRDVGFDVRRGEVLGVVGRNGAGKSTLLQLICGTLTPTAGSIQVNGRVAALLELGAGFNPEFTGRENIYFNAAILGLSKEEIDARVDDIILFSGIIDFIDQPVKTYSSGMFVRLAFSVAVSVEPDILIIDEALAVGDGQFARKSFDRIMQLRNAGVTIVFCSHNLFQIDALCDRAIWLEAGRIAAYGDPGEVLPAYSQALENVPTAVVAEAGAPTTTAMPDHAIARIRSIAVNGREHPGQLMLNSSRDDLRILVNFEIQPSYPPPSIGIGIRSGDGRVVCSAGTHNDNHSLGFDARGYGSVEAIFPALPLLKGEYLLDIYLMCERGIHVYDQARPVATLHMRQRGLEQGLVSIPHHWHNMAGDSE